MAAAAAAAAAAATAVDAGGRDGSLELSRTPHLSRKARSPDMRLAGVRRASLSSGPVKHPLRSISAGGELRVAFATRRWAQLEIPSHNAI